MSNYFFVHAYADMERGLPSQEAVVKAVDEDAARDWAWKEYAAYKEVYVGRASDECVEVAREEGVLR